MPDNPDESSFMRAAVKQVDKLSKANKINMWYRWLSIAVIAGLVWVAVDQHNTDVGLHNGDIASCQAGNDFRRGSQVIWDDFIALALSSGKAALATPAFRAFENAVKAMPSTDPDKKLFQAWLTIQVTSSASSARNSVVADSFRAFVARIDAPRDCASVYGAQSAGAP